MSMTPEEMCRSCRHEAYCIISALCEIENYRKTVLKAPTEDMELSGDKVIMAGNITVEVKNVKGK